MIMAGNEELRSAESMFDSMLHEMECIDETAKEICKPIREAQGKLQDHLKEKFPEAEWDFE
jgi:uncharacterized protein with HEPN domain